MALLGDFDFYNSAWASTRACTYSHQYRFHKSEDKQIRSLCTLVQATMYNQQLLAYIVLNINLMSHITQVSVDVRCELPGLDLAVIRQDAEEDSDYTSHYLYSMTLTGSFHITDQHHLTSYTANAADVSTHKANTTASPPADTGAPPLSPAHQDPTAPSPPTNIQPITTPQPPTTHQPGQTLPSATGPPVLHVPSPTHAPPTVGSNSASPLLPDRNLKRTHDQAS